MACELLAVCTASWQLCGTHCRTRAAVQGERVRVTELHRLRAAVDAVTDATAVAPARALVCDAARSVVPNPLFAGVAYPAKLESYLHAQVRAGRGAHKGTVWPRSAVLGGPVVWRLDNCAADCGWSHA